MHVDEGLYAFVPLVAGLILSAGGLAISTIAPPQASFGAAIFLGMLLMGMGMGVAFPCVMNFAMSDATGADAGLISGLVSTTRCVGGALGLSILAAIAASYRSDRVAFGICTVCLLIGAAI